MGRLQRVAAAIGVAAALTLAVAASGLAEETPTPSVPEASTVDVSPSTSSDNSVETTVEASTTTAATTTTTTAAPSTSTLALSTTTTALPPTTSTNTTTTPVTSLTSAPAGPLAAATVAAAAVPNAPQGFRVAGIADGRLGLVWNAPPTGSPPTTYRLVYAPAGGAFASINLGVRTSYTLIGLQNGKLYYLYLYASTSGGQSPAATTTGIPGRVPSGMSVPRFTNGNHTVTLSWSPPSSNGGYPITSYAIQARTSGSWVTFATVPGTARTFVVRNLTNGRGYSFRIAARNAIGIGPWSYHVIGVPTAPLPPGPSCDASYPGVCIPPAPPDLDCSDITYRRFTVRQPDPHGFDADLDGIGCES